MSVSNSWDGERGYTCSESCVCLTDVLCGPSSVCVGKERVRYGTVSAGGIVLMN